MISCCLNVLTTKRGTRRQNILNGSFCQAAALMRPWSWPQNQQTFPIWHPATSQRAGIGFFQGPLGVTQRSVSFDGHEKVIRGCHKTQDPFPERMHFRKGSLNLCFIFSDCASLQELAPCGIFHPQVAEASPGLSLHLS